MRGGGSAERGGCGVHPGRDLDAKGSTRNPGGGWGGPWARRSELGDESAQVKNM